MKKFSVGDKVRLKSSVQSTFTWIVDWKDKIMTVSQILDYNCVIVKENQWIYSNNRLELVKSRDEVELEKFLLFVNKDFDL